MRKSYLKLTTIVEIGDNNPLFTERESELDTELLENSKLPGQGKSRAIMAFQLQIILSLDTGKNCVSYSTE